MVLRNVKTHQYKVHPPLRPFSSSTIPGRAIGKESSRIVSIGSYYRHYTFWTNPRSSTTGSMDIIQPSESSSPAYPCMWTGKLDNDSKCRIANTNDGNRVPPKDLWVRNSVISGSLQVKPHLVRIGRSQLRRSGHAI